MSFCGKVTAVGIQSLYSALLRLDDDEVIKGGLPVPVNVYVHLANVPRELLKALDPSVLKLHF